MEPGSSSSEEDDFHELHEIKKEGDSSEDDDQHEFINTSSKNKANRTTEE
jgi:hypothetical protein